MGLTLPESRASVSASGCPSSCWRALPESFLAQRVQAGSTQSGSAVEDARLLPVPQCPLRAVLHPSVCCCLLLRNQPPPEDKQSRLHRWIAGNNKGVRKGSGHGWGSHTREDSRGLASHAVPPWSAGVSTGAGGCFPGASGGVGEKPPVVTLSNLPLGWGLSSVPCLEEQRIGGQAQLP